MDIKLTKPIKWADVFNDELVYLFARNRGKEVAIGPFVVVDQKKRVLRRADSKRTFFHYPEELRKIVI